MRLPILTFALVLFCPPTRLPAQATRSGVPAVPGIADNSFLLEEAYNQEAGVVQHISAFQRSLTTGTWAYTFTQEWPVVVQRHQLSLTLPLQRAGGSGAPAGLGDVAINYRHQLGGGDRAVAAAPRLSLVLPTGNETKGLGSGGVGVQVNLPVSMTAGERWVTHWNAGLTWTPKAKSTVGDEAATTAYNLGASAIWQSGASFNVMLEIAWTRAEVVLGPGQTLAGEGLVVSPGIRWAHNFRSGLQIVPGVAFPVGIGPSAGETAVFLYLSFEHAFSAAGR